MYIENSRRVTSKQLNLWRMMPFARRKADANLGKAELLFITHPIDRIKNSKIFRCWQECWDGKSDPMFGSLDVKFEALVCRGVCKNICCCLYGKKELELPWIGNGWINCAPPTPWNSIKRLNGRWSMCVINWNKTWLIRVMWTYYVCVYSPV